MKCPNCRLENPEEALRCDCGYDFEMDEIKESFIKKDSDIISGTINAPAILYVIGWIFSILGGLLGVVISLYIINAKNKDNKYQYKFNDNSRNSANTMLAVGAMILVVGLIVRIYTRFF